MLSKRTKKLQEERMTPKRQRFAIKKLTVGVASVLIGTFFSLSMSIGAVIISADETSTQTVEEVNDSSIETFSSNEEPNLEKSIVTAEEVSEANGTPETTIQSDAISRTNDTTIQNNEPIIKEQPKLFAAVPVDLKGSKIEFNKPTLHVNQDIDAINDLLTREYVENTIIKKLTLSDGTVYEGQALKDVLNENVASYEWSDTPVVDVASDDVYARLRASLNNRRTVTWLMEVNVVGAKAKENLHTPWGTEINAIDAIANTAELKEFDTAIAPVSYDWKEKPNFSPEAGSDHKVTGVVSVNYPDGTTQDVEVTISVDESDAEKYEPKGQNVNTGLNETPKAEDGISNKGDLPESTTYEWKVPVDTSTSGEKDGVVVVKYPDGSSEEVPVKIVVTSDADKYEPKGQDINTGLNETPKAEDGISNKGDLPEGTTYEWKVPVDTSTSGGKDAVVVVKYPDGSSEEISVKVVVTSDAEKYEAKGQDVNTTLNGTPKAEDGISNKGDLPEGTTYEWKSPVDTSTSGEKDGVVVVKYPDGSSEEVPVKVAVTSDADKYEPKGQNVNTGLNETPKAEDGISNKGGLPEGTTYEWKAPVDTSTSGEKDGVVVVKYPDGSSEEVPVKIVVTSDADKYEPKGQDVNTGLNGTPKAEDGISNKGDLPESTTYEWKVPVDTSTSGEKDGVVVVKYPDGSSEEVSVKIVVTDKTTDAVELVPTGQDKGSSPESMKPDVKASANRKVTSDSSGYALPATGDNDSAGLVGLGALLLGSLGLVATRRKKEEV